MLNLLLQRIYRHKLLFYAFLLVLLLLSNLLWQSLSPTTTSLSDVSNQRPPDYFILAASSHSYDSTGQKAHTLTSDYIEHLRHSKTTKLSSPTFVLWPQQQTKQWTASADTGTVYESASQANAGLANSELLWLQGNVLFHNNQHINSSRQESDNASNDTFAFSTQSLQLFYTQDTLYSEAPVTIQQGKNILASKGLVFDLNTNQLNLQSNFTGKIFPRNP